MSKPTEYSTFQKANADNVGGSSKAGKRWLLFFWKSQIIIYSVWWFKFLVCVWCVYLSIMRYAAPPNRTSDTMWPILFFNNNNPADILGILFHRCVWCNLWWKCSVLWTTLLPINEKLNIITKRTASVELDEQCAA